MTLTLSAKPRSEKGTRACRALRTQGLVPAVVYGAGAEPQSLTLTAKEFEKVWHDAGESTIIELSGLAKKATVLIHDVTVDPIYSLPTHVDLYAVRTDQAVTVEVPLVFVGVAPAEKELGGTLIKVMHELEVEALPKDLPHEIEVDISALVTFEDQLHVRDLVLPAGVQATAEPDEVVALVQAAHEMEEESAAAADVTAVEVEKKGKEESADTE